MPFGVGLPEMLIVLVIALVIVGPKRLPELGKSLGSGMRGFKESISGKDDELPPATETKTEARASESEPAKS